MRTGNDSAPAQLRPIMRNDATVGRVVRSGTSSVFTCIDLTVAKAGVGTATATAAIRRNPARAAKGRDSNNITLWRGERRGRATNLPGVHPPPVRGRQRWT